jgi:hypothetical protein
MALMLDRLNSRLSQLADRTKARTIERLATQEQPNGISAEAGEDAVILSGRDLRRHFITDPRLRRFGR